jgi:hypothetical protein
MKAKEFIIELKKQSTPRNFVAKNAKMGGAGPHKDKKKAEKQGDVKHKNKEFSESTAPKKPQPYNDPAWVKKLPKEKLDALAGSRYKKDKKQQDVEEGWKDKVAAAGLAGAMAFGAVGANARTTPGDDPSINRLTGKPIAAQQATDNASAKAEAPKGFSKEYLQAVVDGKHPRPMVSVEKAKELLKNMSEGVVERVRDPEDWDEGNTEPPNNFAVYINGKKWKVFQGRGQYADDDREQAHYEQLKGWARKKSAETGKKWEVSITGEPATR